MIEDIEPTVALSEHFNYKDYLTVETALPFSRILTYDVEVLFPSHRGPDSAGDGVYQEKSGQFIPVTDRAGSREIHPSCHDGVLYTENEPHYHGKQCLAENREKKRLNNINSAFERLKEVIPTFPFEKRLTKMETLRLAISYISMLEDVLESDMQPEMFIHKVLQGDMRMTRWYTHELSARLNWLRWENLGIGVYKQW